MRFLSTSIFCLLTLGVSCSEDRSPSSRVTLEQLREMEGLYWDSQRQLPVSVQVESSEKNVVCFLQLDSIYKSRILREGFFEDSNKPGKPSYAYSYGEHWFTFNLQRFNRQKSIENDKIYEVNWLSNIPLEADERCNKFWANVEKGLKIPSWCWVDHDKHERICIAKYPSGGYVVHIPIVGQLSSDSYVAKEQDPSFYEIDVSFHTSGEIEPGSSLEGTLHIKTPISEHYTCEATAPVAMHIKKRLLDVESCQNAELGWSKVLP